MFMSVTRKGTDQVPSKENDDYLMSKQQSQLSLEDLIITKEQSTIKKQLMYSEQKPETTQVLSHTYSCLEKKVIDEQQSARGWEQKAQEYKVHLLVLQKVNDDLINKVYEQGTVNHQLVQQIRETNNLVIDPKVFEKLYQKVIEMEQDYIVQQRAFEVREKEINDYQKEIYHSRRQPDEISILNQIIISLKLELTNYQNETGIKIKNLQKELSQDQKEIQNLRQNKIQFQNTFTEQENQFQGEIQQLKLEVEQSGNYYNEILSQNQQLQRRIEQCLQLIQTQESQFVNEGQQMRRQIQDLQKQKDETLKEKVVSDQRIQTFKNKLEQIDKIDSQLKPALENIEFENKMLRQENIKLERTIKSESQKNEQQELKLKTQLSQIQALEVIQNKSIQNTQQAISIKTKKQKIKIKYLYSILDEQEQLLLQMINEQTSFNPLLQRNQIICSEFRKQLSNFDNE